MLLSLNFTLKPYCDIGDSGQKSKAPSYDDWYDLMVPHWVPC